jgi:short-subunit dehydrogenase
LTQVVLITGASSGIGYATAVAFANRGANIAVTARRAERLTELRRVIAGIPSPHGECLPITADVTDADAVQQAVAQTVERFGKLDVLVANAGIGQRGALADASWDDIETVLHTNIDGVLHSVRAALPALKQSHGHIVLVSSVAGVTATPYASIYGASKAFVSSLARSLSIELEADGITVTELLLGPVATEFSQKRRGAQGHGSAAANVPSMTAEHVAEGIVKATERRSKTAFIRLYDRLILLVNSLVPDFIGRQALKRYQPDQSVETR